MAGVHSRPGANGTALWYADVYIEGRSRQFPLTRLDRETGRKLRPRNEDEARRWAANLERDLRKQVP